MTAAQMDLDIGDLALREPLSIPGMNLAYAAQLCRAWAPRWPFGEEEGHACPGGFGSLIDGHEMQRAEPARVRRLRCRRRGALHPTFNGHQGAGR